MNLESFVLFSSLGTKTYQAHTIYTTLKTQFLSWANNRGNNINRQPIRHLHKFSTSNICKC